MNSSVEKYFVRCKTAQIQIHTKQGLIVGQKMSKIGKKRGSVPSPVPPLNKGTTHWPKITERSAERGTFGRSLLQ